MNRGELKVALLRPARSVRLGRSLYRFCRRYVDWMDGCNDADWRFNGEFRFLSRMLSFPEVRVVFDVGANKGTWAWTCLDLRPSVQVHCFEPSPTTFRRLAAADLAGDVHLNNFGLGEVSEDRTFFILAEGAETNSLYRHHQIDESESSSTECVMLRTLDGYCEERGIQGIDLVKVDVEGHEHFVFRGARKMLGERRIGAIQFEYSVISIESRVFLKDQFEFFAGFGYRMYRMVPDGLIRIKDYHPRLEDFRYCNYVALTAQSEDRLADSDVIRFGG